MKAAANEIVDGLAPAPPMDAAAIIELGKTVLRKEMQAIQASASRLGESFAEAVQLVLNCRGRVAVTGLGKAGLIGNKIQATLSSTATPAFFLHPVEALHGDLGMICPEDVVIALTRSGETQELIELLPSLSRIGCRIILLTSRPASSCARLSDIVIDIGDVPEACPLGMAPSSSAAAMHAVGDAITLTVMELRKVQPEQYAAFHPGGALGRSLMKVHQIMRTERDCPTLRDSGCLADYFEAIEKAPRRAGAAIVVDATGRLQGIFTHGDLFRLHRRNIGMSDPAGVPLKQVMTAPCKSVRADEPIARAIETMQSARIDELPVVDADGMLVGMIDIQDLVARGFSVFDNQ
jgi:arabinose-5-phosphate isomerase